jgi:hypothetical protein
MDFSANDVGFVPNMAGHYVENIGDEDLIFIELSSRPSSRSDAAPVDSPAVTTVHPLMCVDLAPPSLDQRATLQELLATCQRHRRRVARRPCRPSWPADFRINGRRSLPKLHPADAPEWAFRRQPSFAQARTRRPLSGNFSTARFEASLRRGRRVRFRKPSLDQFQPPSRRHSKSRRLQARSSRLAGAAASADPRRAAFDDQAT